MRQGMRIVCMVAVAWLVLDARPGQAFLELLLKDDIVRLFLGTSTPFYLVEEGYDSQLARSGVLQSLPALEPKRGRLTFEWSAAKPVHYVILAHSGDTSVMRTPRASIPLSSTVPRQPTEFHFDFPCTGIVGGKTFLTITFAFFDHNGKPLYNEPFTLALPRECKAGKVDMEEEGKVIAGLSDKDKEDLQKSVGRPLGHHVDPAHPGVSPIKQFLKPNPIPRLTHHDPTPPHVATKPPTTRPPIDAPTESMSVKEASHQLARPLPRRRCGMCEMPTDLSELKEQLCKSAFVIRARLSQRSSSRSSKFLLSLRDVKKIYSSRPIVANAIRRLQGTQEGRPHQDEELLLRLNVGRPGGCTCHGQVNDQDLYLVAGKFSSRRGQLIVRHSKGLLIPWRQAKHMVRSLRPLRC